MKRTGMATEFWDFILRVIWWFGGRLMNAQVQESKDKSLDRTWILCRSLRAGILYWSQWFCLKLELIHTMPTTGIVNIFKRISPVCIAPYWYSVLGGQYFPNWFITFQTLTQGFALYFSLVILSNLPQRLLITFPLSQIIFLWWCPLCQGRKELSVLDIW